VYLQNQIRKNYTIVLSEWEPSRTSNGREELLGTRRYLVASAFVTRGYNDTGIFHCNVIPKRKVVRNWSPPTVCKTAGIHNTLKQ